MHAIAPPRDAIAAVMHPDPYPWYAALREGPPLVFDAALTLWIASRADVVARALAHPGLRVRPPGEPVPRGIASTPAGVLFGQLVRMNDGAAHAAHKPALQALLARFDTQAARAAALHAAGRLAPMPLDDWCFALPVASTAVLLGFGDEALDALVRWTRAFAACLPPLSGPAQWEAASAAALHLIGSAGTLREAAARSTGFHANLAGLLVQSCDAGAALLGSAIVALARRPALRELRGERLHDVIAEVARHDAPVQNTRRFAAEAMQFEGCPLARGDALLLVLAAANRDPALNPDPDAFRLDRPARRLPGFGDGAHRCPGQAVALATAAAGIESLLAAGFDFDAHVPARIGYRASVNSRIPLFQETSP